MAEKVAASKVVDQGAQGGALIKLLAFSASLAVAPITSYFASLKYVWNGNATYAAITAVVSANIVLITYIILSVIEDKGDQEKSKRSKQELETRKTR